MADRNKKRTSSFRKLFPSIFFSNKPKDKNGGKGSQQSRLKESTDGSTANNHYQNPKSISASDRYNQQTDQYDSCIYENLTIRQSNQQSSIFANEALSNHSSSSTLVSESVKTSPEPTNNTRSPIQLGRHHNDYAGYTARPQVPPRPHNAPQPQRNNDQSQYPDVYYHSLEKITDQISPLDKIEIYRASKSNADPEPVGAEIKKMSTTFLISPKKQAEVRTIQPTRARSLSFNKVKENQHLKPNTNIDRNESTVTKPYNYSAPTSPIPLNHKIPSMPKTVSPYQNVRKTMMEVEEKRNSLSRTSTQNRSTPSPQIDNIRPSIRISTPNSSLTRDIPKKLEDKDKEKTRQKVEAFYWQKLKELKEKEDEYYMKQSINNTTNDSMFRNSNCSSPNSIVVEPRSYSLPRGQNLNSLNNVIKTAYVNPPFTRGVTERRTDTFITHRNTYRDSEIVYRHPEKLNQRFISSGSTHDTKQMSLPLRGSLTRNSRNGNQQPKRVSFEEQSTSEATTLENYCTKSGISESKRENKNFASSSPRFECSPKASAKVGNEREKAREPPRPPARTTSVAKSYNIGNNRTNFVGRSPYSESESGSEAGEIQRILQNTARKVLHGDIEKNTQEKHKKADKSIQVYMTHKFRSKAIQAEIKVTNQISSPMKPDLQSVSTSPFKISKITTHVKPTTSTRKLFETEDKSNSDISYTPSIMKRESSPATSFQMTSTSDCSELIQDDKKQEASQILHCTLYKICRNPRSYIGVPKDCYFLIDILEKNTNIPATHILMCLKKIRLNNSFRELGDDFSITPSYASKIFFKHIPLLASAMRPFIVNLDKDSIKNHLPMAFRHKYHHVSCIIDCLEIEIQKPSKALNQSLSWSEYKKANTIKYLVSCTPNGLVNYISPGYGGRITDTCLIESCDFIKCLQPGMHVMADRGFKHVESYLLKHGVKLVRPPSVTTGVKLSKNEARETKQIASLRIHVERVIRRLREFSLLKPHSCVNLNLVKVLDDIITIACGLINLQDSLIK